MAVISSSSHPLFKKWKALVSDAGARREQGRLAVEGPHLVEEALQARAEPLGYLCTGEFARHAGHQELIGQLQRRRIPQAVISEKLMARLALTRTPQGILLAVRLPGAKALQAWQEVPGDLVVLAHGLQDPGNLGTLLRCCWAAGCSGVLLGGQAVDPWSAKALRAGAGAQFHTRCFGNVDSLEILKVMKERGLQIVAACPRAGLNYLDVNLRKPLCMVFGAEGPGLPDEIMEVADIRARIEYPGKAESLNISVSAAVFLFETLRQRGKRL